MGVQLYLELLHLYVEKFTYLNSLDIMYQKMLP